jgi:hypothetical protein
MGLPSACADENELTIPPEWAALVAGPPLVPSAAHEAYALVAGLGAKALPALEDMSEVGGWIDGSEQRAAADAMSVIPTDEAFLSLLTRATQSLADDVSTNQAASNERHFGEALERAMARFPRRAIRLLAPLAVGRGLAVERYRGLLTLVVRRAPDVARAMLGALPDEGRGVVVELLERARALEPAAHDALPSVLREPPWARKRKKPKKRGGSVALEPLSFEPRMVWRGDERLRWAEEPVSSVSYYQEQLRRISNGTTDWALAAKLVDQEPLWGAYLLWAPLSLAREHAGRWFAAAPLGSNAIGYVAAEWMGPVVARLELDACEPLLRAATSSLGKVARFLVPFGMSELAPFAARALTMQSARDHGMAWLLRHPEVAAIGLVPDALGNDAKRAKLAREALVILARAGQGATVRDVTARYGAAAVEGMAAILDADPLDDYPSRLPAMPELWDPVVLERPELRTGGVLSAEALDTLGTMLAFSKPGSVYAGVRQVRDACTEESISRFSWSLFEAWMRAGGDVKHRWAFLQLGWLGGDDIAHRLVRVIRSWPAQGAHKRAELALDVLAEMESDVALLLIHQMTQKTGSRSLRKNAAKKLGQLAAQRGLGEADLTDRLVPTLDLDESGAMVLDYGARRFRVGFDEQLRPYVLDQDGRALRSLPKPGAKDDATLAPRAEKRFKDLKKNVRSVAASQIKRFEEAMCAERRWSVEDFTRYLVWHPLLVHLARRLVWGLHEAGVLQRSFRVTAERTFASEEDDEVMLPAGSSIGILHPTEIEESVRLRWSAVFSDYELLQPFVQLDRDIHVAATDEDRDRLVAELLEGSVDAARIVGLEGRGWERGPVEDGGRLWSMERAMSGGARARIELDPGLAVGAVATSEAQRVTQLDITRGGAAGSLGDLSVVSFSELVRDLRALRA